MCFLSLLRLSAATDVGSSVEVASLGTESARTSGESVVSLDLPWSIMGSLSGATAAYIACSDCGKIAGLSVRSAMGFMMFEFRLFSTVLSCIGCNEILSDGLLNQNIVVAISVSMAAIPREYYMRVIMICRGTATVFISI